ncbi:FmdE family protein [Azospirillum sp. ST 5-10]|uniref:FmdE family protein n=1 Tax=unclassified Azospirillum TaxID=2630922 RepID=UPI003F49B846
MTFPAFFAAAPRLTVRDPLGAFLGASADGRLDYGYADAVRLAGHSCPTVAGAYLMTVRALAHLYPGTVPERGAVAVSVRDRAGDGVAGVLAAVAALLTGAAGDGGFKGIGGRFDRRRLLSFGADLADVLGFVRTDTGRGVQAALDTTVVPADPELPELLRRAASGHATAAEEERFRRLWQDRVRRMLVDHADDPRLVILTPWTPR